MIRVVLSVGAGTGCTESEVLADTPARRIRSGRVVQNLRRCASLPIGGAA